MKRGQSTIPLVQHKFLHTNGRCSFIQDQKFAVSHNRTGQRYDLALTDRQIVAAAGDLAVQSKTRLVRLALKREEAGCAKCVVQREVVVLAEGVQVAAERAYAQKVSLQDPGGSWSNAPLRSSGIWGMIVMFERSSSRLSLAVSCSS